MRKLVSLVENVLGLSGAVLTVWVALSWINVLFGGGNITWWNFFLLFTEMFG